MNRREKTVLIHDDFHNQDVLLDSMEEWQFYNWLLDAWKLGIVLDFKYQPESFELIPRITYKPLFPENKSDIEKPLFRQHIFTADFKVKFDIKYGKQLSSMLKLFEPNSIVDDGNAIEIYVDTKGMFINDGMKRTFSLNQKLVWLKFGKYIEKIVPKLFFEKAGCPERCRFSYKTKKPNVVFAGCPDIKQVFELS